MLNPASRYTNCWLPYPYIHMCVHVIVQVDTCAHLWVAHEVVQLSSSVVHHLFFESESFTEPGAQQLSWTGWLASSRALSACLYLPSTRITDMCCHTFSMASREVLRLVHQYASEPSPQSFHAFLSPKPRTL